MTYDHKKDVRRELDRFAERLFACDRISSVLPSANLNERSIGFQYYGGELAESNDFTRMSVQTIVVPYFSSAAAISQIGLALFDLVPPYSHSVIEFCNLWDDPSADRVTFDLVVWFPDEPLPVVNIFERLQCFSVFQLNMDEFLDHIGFYDFPLQNSTVTQSALDYIKSELATREYDFEDSIELVGSGNSLWLNIES